MIAAATVVKNLTMHKLSFPILSEDETGTANPADDLPFAPVDTEADGPMQKVVQSVGTVSNHRGDIDRDVILGHFRRKTFENLPLPFRLKEAPPSDCTMQLFVAPRGGGG
eukprot:7888474-Pyramimonas_sp.AAC.1